MTGPQEHNRTSAARTHHTGSGRDSSPRHGKQRRSSGNTKKRGSAQQSRNQAPHISLARLQRDAELRTRVEVPPITYPAQLPVSARRDEIAAAIAAHQVVIVAGETGSGKTTQLPKIALELGRGRKGQIGHTQPRRIAARTVAERIAEEVGTPLGDIVGYQVRFTDESSQSTLVKVMTDGILLAHIQRDPQLLAYDTLIIDEAHERSLNIDFLLGYLTRLLPQRPDLKVIITSATIDSERFARHFAPGGPITDAELTAQTPLRPLAPVVEVSGRTFPVEVRYRPIEDDDQDMTSAICSAFDELQLEGPGDVLVFLSGERDIHDTAEALEQHLGSRATDPRTPGYTQILPLYARLSAAEQHRVFHPHQHRRIVLATNVAETSLTVPGIRYVIDPGTARISRYSKSTKVQRLPIEPVSQASANQRSGRCGRVSDGVAIRLYSEEDFVSRPEFTEPEILRTSLASVLLHMISVGVANGPDDVANFPFVEAPDTRAIRDGVQLLQELGALEYRGNSQTTRKATLTTVGKQLATLPMDPRLARMIVEGGIRGVAHEVMIIAAVMSIQDPRERPTEVRDLADAHHSRFVDGHSDFMTYLNLWEYIRQQQRALSSSAFRRMCKAEYLNFLRIREWQDVVAQLREMTRSLGIESQVRKAQPLRDKIAEDQGITPGGRADERTPDTKFVWDATTIHRSLLAGLLSHIGMQEATEVRAHKTGRETAADKRAKRMARNEYLGARGARFAIFPGSPLSKKPPAWVMAGELVETSRLWGRDVARIEPEWAEELAAGIVKTTYSDPHWSRKRGAAIAHEKVLLYGVPIVTERPVLYAKVDAEAARDLFIRHALVAGEWSTHHKFYTHNRAVLAQAEELEARSRQRGLMADEETLFAFYDERIPDTVVSARHFDQWWKGARTREPHLLDFSLDVIIPQGHDHDLDDQFPQTWQQGDITLPLTYQFSPGSEADGVTVHVPIQVLNRVSAHGFDWMVPGLLDELCIATIRALPKVIRRELVPAPDWGAKIAQWLQENTPQWEDMTRAGDMAEPFATAFKRAAWSLKYLDIPDDAFDQSSLPAHLQVTFKVFHQHGTGRRAIVDILGEGKNLTALQQKLAHDAQEAVRRAVKGAVGEALAHAQHARDTQQSARQPKNGTTSAGIAGGPEHITHTIAEIPALTQWPESPAYDSIPTTVEGRGPGGIEVRGYPALCVEKGSDKIPHAALRILADRTQQDVHHRQGVWRLLVDNAALQPARITSRWTGTQALTLAASPYPHTDALVADVQLAAVMSLVPHAHAIRSREAYEQALTHVRAHIEDETYRIVKDVVAALAAYRDLDVAVSRNKSLALLAVLNDVRTVSGGLVYAGFISATPAEQLRHIARYVRAQIHRIDKAADSVHRDTDLTWKINNVVEQFNKALLVRNSAGLVGLDNPGLVDVKWMIEELRVSLYAVQLGTNGSVSEKRILKAISAAVA
ncbi:ATP-dependent RNA helicase HrpA [Timonella sp. A28]|uniref:ATP-dependent RNA helicase HrpA n=1 Tax=Timonella sp. A28 TaxID=3442640 RepID=UPI003EC0CE15